MLTEKINITNQEILEIAVRQSALDCNCREQDFFRNENIVVLSKKNPKARKYIPLPLECDLVSYGSNIVAQVSAELLQPVSLFLKENGDIHLFETPKLHLFDEFLQSFGLRSYYMAEYFLPDIEKFKLHTCAYAIRLLDANALEPLYLPQWSNALSSAENKERDVCAVGAYDGDTLVGLAGCSADCDHMYQIGVDVLPKYRAQGIAAAVTSRLAYEVFKLGKVPFYCAAWSNIISVKNALKCGFKPAWTELTARKIEYVNEQNKNRR